MHFVDRFNILGFAAGSESEHDVLTTRQSLFSTIISEYLATVGFSHNKYNLFFCTGTLCQTFSKSEAFQHFKIKTRIANQFTHPLSFMHSTKYNDNTSKLSKAQH